MDYCFIVAAPRSGTKILRDTLGAHPDVRTTQKPREELWATDLADPPNDVYPPDKLTDRAREQIRNQFKEWADGAELFVEKNVRHSLRIPYVRAVFPNARFIHIVRHPVDEIASNIEHKKDPFDWSYYLSAKAFDISPVDMVKHTIKLGLKTLRRLFTSQQDVAIWGPRFEGFQSAVNQHGPFGISLLQWIHCAGSAQRDGEKLGGDYHLVRYEDLMRSPTSELTAIAQFLDLDATELVRFADNTYRTDRIGRGQETLSQPQLDQIKQEAGELIEKFGYTLERVEDP